MSDLVIFGVMGNIFKQKAGWLIGMHVKNTASSRALFRGGGGGEGRGKRHYTYIRNQLTWVY